MFVCLSVANQVKIFILLHAELRRLNIQSSLSKVTPCHFRQPACVCPHSIFEVDCVRRICKIIYKVFVICDKNGECHHLFVKIILNAISHKS